MMPLTGPSFQTTLHLTSAFYAGQLVAGEILDQLSSGKTSKRDTHLFQQASQLSVKLQTAEHTEQTLEQHAGLTAAMATSVTEVDALFDQIIDLLKVADNDGTISTERADILRQIRDLNGEIHRKMQATHYLGENLETSLVTMFSNPNMSYLSSPIMGPAGLVEQFIDGELQDLHDTLDTLTLQSQDDAEAALLIVEDLKDNVFGIIKQPFLWFAEAMEIELSQNRAYQLSLANSLNALQGVSIPELLNEFSKQSFKNDMIISAILSSETANQNMLHLFKYTPIETIDRLSPDWLDPSQK